MKRYSPVETFLFYVALGLIIWIAVVLAVATGINLAVG